MEPKTVVVMYTDASDQYWEADDVEKEIWKYKGLTTADIDYLIDVVHASGNDLPTGYKIPRPSIKKAAIKKKGAVKCLKLVKKTIVPLGGSALPLVKPSSITSTPVSVVKRGRKKPTK